jgi:methylamine dehydrogenase accessory protein MauD
MNVLVISNLLLWVVVLALMLICLALARQIGILYERVAPMGALMLDKGPAVGEKAPNFSLRTLRGSMLTIGASEVTSTQATLLFFLSPTCPVCKKLLPIIKRLAERESNWLRIVLASDGEQPEHLAFVNRAGLSEFPYVLSTELGMSYQISKLPYTVLIGSDGLIKAKGLVNSREQIESLFNANDLGVASVQEHVNTTLLTR